MNAYKIVELTAAQKLLIKATIPILEKSGVDLTAAFYQRMLTNNPSVRPFFNVAHQKSKAQPKILAYSLLAYAKNIDDISPLTTFVNQIVTKHVGLQVQPEQYPIVGENLLATMHELLGDEIATPELLEAWGVAYGNLAKILIDAENACYVKNQWQGFKEFEVSKIEPETDDVKSVYLKPIEGEIQPPKRGQYLGIRWRLPEAETTREYSISQYPDNGQYRISVKRDANGGVVSNYIQDTLKVGDKVGVSAPAGSFTYKETKSEPVLLLAGGIGITPLVLIAEVALKDGRNVELYYSNDHSRPFTQWFKSIKNQYGDKFKLKEFISHGEVEKIDEL